MRSTNGGETSVRRRRTAVTFMPNACARRATSCPIVPRPMIVIRRPCRLHGHAPSVPETDRLIGARQIALLNRGAILINVARGRIVDEAAMIAALQNGQLGGAVLDVFDHEPLDTGSVLWTLPNVVITPHSSGVRPDHWDEVIDLFSENLDRFQRGELLLNVVDCAAGY